MRSAKAAFLGLAIACLGATDELSAQVPTDRTYLEFTIPARIPGATLAPGMYLFVIGRSVGGQSIIDIYSSDGSRLVASCLGIESALPRPPQATLIDYPGMRPAALRAWFHPANAWGLEFVYSLSEAREIFTATRLPVAYGPFKSSSRGLIGAFPVSYATPVPMIGIAHGASFAPTSAGTLGMTALIEMVDESLGPHQHLTTVRRMLATRASQTRGMEKSRMEMLGKQVTQLQAAYRRSDEREVEKQLSMLEKTLLNLTPIQTEITERRQQPLSRDMALLLERVEAHVRAFTLAAGIARSRPSPNHP